jgi:uncharacterized SAM-binding protein YcdF (DUF218 family)
MSVFLTRILESLVMPPLGPMLLILFGLLFRRLRFFAWFGLIALYLASIPASQNFLANQIEQIPEVDTLGLMNLERAVIVVLAYDGNPAPLEFKEPANYGKALDRLRYAAYLSKNSGLPILVTGGDPFMEGFNASDIMSHTLRRDFGVANVLKESSSKTTFEHGVYVTEILLKRGIDTVVLVTTASHMSRAVKAFDNRGLNIIPAPTGFGRNNRYEDRTIRNIVESLIPNAGSVLEIRILLHEWLGDLWYRLKHSATYAIAD